MYLTLSSSSCLFWSVLFLFCPHPPRPTHTDTLLPSTTLCLSPEGPPQQHPVGAAAGGVRLHPRTPSEDRSAHLPLQGRQHRGILPPRLPTPTALRRDRKSTRLKSSP